MPVLRKALIAAFLLASTPTAALAAERTLLMPGVTYERQVQFTSHGPVAVHVLRAPRPGGSWSLSPVVSNNAIVGRERVTAMQRTLSGGATAVGVNGDISAPDGRPAGVQLRAGVLEHAPLPERASIGITSNGSLRVDRVRFFGTWQGSGQRRAIVLNDLPGTNQISLFTPSWGPLTPPAAGAVEAVIDPLPPARLDGELRGPVTSLQQTSGNTAIPPNGAVLQARGTAAQRLAEESQEGSIGIRLQLSPDWVGVVDALGGGPLLVRDGRPVFRHGEVIPSAQVARAGRSAVGQGADGRIVLVTVDGQRAGYSVGMTSFELAQTMVRLGAVTAAGLEAGGAATMAFDGTLLNRPSDPGGERAVSNGLFVVYDGVVAAPPGEAVLSPNGDGVGEVQTLSYKLPRAATVQVRLVGPRGVERELESGPKAAGVQRLTWSGRRPDGSPEPDGDWRFTVTAVDERGETTTADRVFVLNRTLGALRVSPSLLRVRPGGPRLQASFELARPAQVTTRIESTSGTVVAVVGRTQLSAGRRSVPWNGTIGDGRLARSGRYVLRVIAVNDLGRAELTAPFAVRRVAAPARPAGR